MIIPSKHWKTIKSDAYASLNETTRFIHKAAQFMAMSAKLYAESKPDDSHTNMSWQIGSSRFLGNSLYANGEFVLALDLNAFEICLLDSSREEVGKVILQGKEESVVLNEFTRLLSTQGFDTSNFTLDLHYDLPTTDVYIGNSYKSITLQDLEVFTAVRTIGQLSLEPYASKYEHASSVRTWPHHFDIGSYIPLQFDDNGEALKSISLGLSIADDYVGEYYFYVTHWSRDEAVDYSTLSSLPGKSYWNQKDWVGAVLPFSNVIHVESVEEQVEVVNTFLRQAIDESILLLSSN